MSARKVQLFNVAVAIPPELEFLETLSRNMWWCWNLDAVELFRRINPQVWRDAWHNPLEFLNSIPQQRLEALVEDDGFMSHLQQVEERFEAEVLHDKAGRPTSIPQRCIAYFSLEYGIHESVRLYSGGLGVLAGDHLKAASDGNLPLVAVGLLYCHGYFQQYLNNDGWQQETYPENEIHRMPILKACDDQKRQIYVEVPCGGGQILKAGAWKIDVGRIPLILLDSNIPENPPELRRITGRLYGGDRQTRLCQELLLGIGGLRALLALGYDPGVSHMNEGHASFQVFARIAHLCRSAKLDVKTAAEVVQRTSVFTTHTPVPAGNEVFTADLVRPYLEALSGELGLDPSAMLALGQGPNGGHQSELSMTVLGLRMAQFSNGVSKLHGRVARKMWSHLWPDKPVDEVPIRHITNGVHVSSWLSPDMTVLYDRYLGSAWRDEPSGTAVLAEIQHIPDEELWRAHELGRSRLVRIARDRAEKQFLARNASRAEVAQAKSILDQDVLTIGFARRFATYKRATLLLRDQARLEAMLTNDQRPVQIVFAGKAHPADDTGKDFIREIVHFARKANVRRNVVFLEDYDMYIARSMVQGVDVWLNAPRRPLEASGTSGMKAAMNGVLNISVLDGWWCEGYNENCGWAIGNGDEYDDYEYQDTVESQALYNLLENEVIPMFYERPTGDVSVRWAKMMKASVRMALGYFTSHRMVSEYNQMYYQPAMKEYESLQADNWARARSLVLQRERLSALWNEVGVSRPVTDKDVSVLHVGDKFSVTTRVRLGQLRPEEVDVEVYSGPVNSESVITESHVEPMALASSGADGTHVYEQVVACRTTGRYGFTTRATPRGSEWKNVIPGFVTWANGMDNGN